MSYVGESVGLSLSARAAIAGTVMAGVMLGAAGCELGGVPQPTPSISESPVATLPPPAPACELPAAADTAQQPESKAIRCQAVMQAADVVIVNFDVAEPVVDAVASDLSEFIEVGTHGKVHSKVRTVLASSAAKAVLRNSSGSKGCIDWSKPKGSAPGPEASASTAADATMVEVRDADFVISLTSMKYCKPGTYGMGEVGGRHADIFIGSMAGRTEQGVKYVAASSAAHEYGHLLGLEHAGSVTTMVRGSSVGLAQTNVHLGAPFDLGSYLKAARYDEYGDSVNIMGITDWRSVHSDPVDDYFLSWPQTVLDKKSNPSKAVIGTQKVTLTASDSANERFAYVKLDQPVRLQDAATQEKGDTGGLQEFSYLAFVPHLEGGNNAGVGLILFNEKRFIAGLGTITPANSGDQAPATTVITYGHQRFEITTTSSQTRVRQLAA